LFFGGRGLTTLLLFLYVTEEAGRICVRDMPWPLAAECNMITNKQTRPLGCCANGCQLETMVMVEWKCVGQNSSLGKIIQLVCRRRAVGA
jgi:hypothetical protein